jgi:hypothetical protein
MLYIAQVHLPIIGMNILNGMKTDGPSHDASSTTLVKVLRAVRGRKIQIHELCPVYKTTSPVHDDTKCTTIETSSQSDGI